MSYDGVAVKWVEPDDAITGVVYSDDIGMPVFMDAAGSEYIADQLLLSTTASVSHSTAYPNPADFQIAYEMNPARDGVVPV